jgi:hypothetical protein
MQKTIWTALKIRLMPIIWNNSLLGRKTFQRNLIKYTIAWLVKARVWIRKEKILKKIKRNR